MKILELLQQRRIWAAILGVVGFIVSVFNVDYSIDVETMTGMITNFFVALSSVVSAGLALWSYLLPKKK